MSGYAIPAVAALLAIPVILGNMGTQKLGVLTLVWTLIGFFGLFDVGLGRSVTHFAARAHGRGDKAEFTAVATVGTVALLAVGLVVGISLWIAARTLDGIGPALSHDLYLQKDMIVALTAAGAPIALISVGLRSSLEAAQDFRSVNLIRIPTGALTFVAPATVSLCNADVVPAVASVVFARLLATVGFLLFLVPKLSKPDSWRFDTLGKLARYGGWASISGVISPLLVHVDRFVIAGQLSLDALAMYGSIFDVIARLLVIPSAVAGALFPALSSLQAGSYKDLRAAYLACSGVILLALGGIAAVLGTFAHPLIALWLGNEFAEATSTAAVVLLIGIVLNGYAHIPHTCLQGMGRPDIPARFHIFELVIYVPLLFVLIQRYGIMGAACAWLLRVLIDATLLTAALQRQIRAHQLHGH